MKTNEYQLVLEMPRGQLPTVEFGRHFAVSGRILHESSLPKDASLAICLYDSEGMLVRHACQDRKNNPNVYVDHPDLVCYEDSLDPGREGIRRFGFPELMVRDLSAPLQSLGDATIKCWYSDDCFKAIIVSATDQAHGLYFDDGIGLTDEDGAPYTALPRGRYTLSVILSDHEGNRLAEASKELLIEDRTDQVICRFNPVSHKENMLEWSHALGISISEDTMPGYLDPYLGKWYYHMGLLPMYRACDIAAYSSERIHMFVYLIDPTSTSYETELAFLQTKGIVGDPDRFYTYHYDIGEAQIKSAEGGAREGRIVPFPKDTDVVICRVDVVNEKARENVFDLNEESVKLSLTDLRDVTVHAGEDIAIMGVVKPWQMNPDDFILEKENIYTIKNSVNRLHYSIDDGSVYSFARKNLMLERRVDGESIGHSVYEFYNLFHIGEEMKGKTLRFYVTACDNDGERRSAVASVSLHVL